MNAQTLNFDFFSLMVQDVPASSSFPHVIVETIINDILTFNKTQQRSCAQMWFTMWNKHKHYRDEYFSRWVSF